MTHAITLTTDHQGNPKAVCACGWANSHPIPSVVDDWANDHLADEETETP